MAVMIASTSRASRYFGSWIGCDALDSPVRSLRVDAPRASSSGHCVSCHGAATLVREVLRAIPANPGLLVQFKEGVAMWCAVECTKRRYFLALCSWGSTCQTDLSRWRALATEDPSYLVFSEWEKVFANPMATAAAIDRIVHRSVILEFDVPSSEPMRHRISGNCGEATGARIIVVVHLPSYRTNEARSRQMKQESDQQK